MKTALFYSTRPPCSRVLGNPALHRPSVHSASTSGQSQPPTILHPPLRSSCIRVNDVGNTWLTNNL